MWGNRGSAALGALTALVVAVPTWAANDPKDLSSQNAEDARVFQSTGQAHLRIDIPAPKGTGGSEPDVALTYTSHLSDGPFGIGWAIKLGEIRRTARFGTPAYDDSVDEFEFDGVLLVADVANPGEYRTFQESFARIKRNGESWEVNFPDGRTARFGTNQETRIRKDGSTNFETDSGEVGRWLLSELEDASGNVTRFSYDRVTDVGTAYPKKISYSYRDGSQTPVGGTERKIEFVLENRNEEIYGFPVGIETLIGKRVGEIRSLAGGQVYRRLVLNYAATTAYTTGRTRLASTQLFGTDCPLNEDPEAPSGPDFCNGRPPKTFTYTDSDSLANVPGSQWASSNWNGDPSNHFSEGNQTQQGRDRGVRIGDINGDGYPDFVQAWRKESTGFPTPPAGNGDDFYRIFLSEGDGWGVRDSEWEDRLEELTVVAHTILEDRANGKVCSVSFTQSNRRVFFRNEVVFDSEAPQRIFPPIEARLMDLNGDGLADIVLSFEIGAGSATAASPCGDTTWPASPTVKYVWINTGDPALGWEDQSDLWADSLPPFYSIYYRTDEGTGESTPGSALPPGEKRGTTSASTNGATYAHFLDHGVRMPDLNGDGRPDIIVKRDPLTFGGAEVYTFPEGAWLSSPDGVGWVQHDEYIPPTNIVAEFNYFQESPTEPRPKYVNDADAGVRFADLNGDGLADLVKTAVAPLPAGSDPMHGPLGATLLEEGVWLNTGDGWCGVAEGCVDEQNYLPTVSAAPFIIISNIYRTERHIWGGNRPVVRGSQLAFVDLNGDGLVDLIKTDSPDLTGLNAWLHDPSDPNVWVNNSETTPFIPPDEMATTGQWIQGGDVYIYDNGVRIFDYDGDATVDLLRDVKGEGRSVFLSVTAHADLVETFDNGRGGSHTFTYASAIGQRDDVLEGDASADASSSGEIGSIGIPRWTARPVVAQLTLTDNLAGGDSHSKTMTYAMPQWDPAYRSQLGFRAVETLRDDGSMGRTFFWQQPGRAGRAARVSTFDDQGALRREQTMMWEVIPGTEAEGSIEGVGVVIGRLVEETATNYYGDFDSEVAGADQTTSYFYTDGVGSYGYNFIHQIVATRPTGTLTIDRIPEPADTANWIIGKLDKEIQTDGNGAILAETEFDYDRGLPTMIKRTVDFRHVPVGSQFATTQNLYDEYGNLIQTTDPKNRTTYLCYDGDTSLGPAGACSDGMGGTNSHTVLVAVKDPLGEVTSYVRDFASGSIRTLNREYSGDSEWVMVDPFGRVAESWTLPAGQPTATILMTREYFDDPVNLAVRPFIEERNYFDQRSVIDESATVRTALYQDGFGREMVAVSPAVPGHAFPFGGAITDRDYAGRPLRQTLDLACTDAECTNLATDSGMDEILQMYDALGRILTRTTPDGVTAFAYSQSDLILPTGPVAGEVSLDVVLSMDLNGNLTEHLLDGDRLVMANECSNVISPPTETNFSGVTCDTPDSTFYTYEASGELDTIYDAMQDYMSAAHRLRYRYDTLGRAWSLEDPDAGTTTTNYDLVGNVIDTSDDRNLPISYQYDELDRLTFIDPPDGVQGDWDNLTLTYDPVTRRRASVASTGSYSDTWEYDEFGNLEKNVRDMNSRTLRTDFKYDLLGRPTSLQSPLATVEGVSYGYEGGYLTSVCSTPDLSNCTADPSLYLVDGVVYDQLGRIQTVQESPGDLNFEYYTGSDPVAGSAIRRVKTMTLGDATKLNLTYTYNPGGDVIRVDDAHTSDTVDATADYTYDNRNRIRSWTNSEDISKYFKYDAIGNLIGRDLDSAGENANQLYLDPGRPHAVTTSHAGTAYNYDEAGNVIQRGDEYLTYNSMGQVSCVGTSQSPCIGGAFWYDFDGNLLSKTVGVTSEIYLGDYFRLDKGANIAWTYTSAFGKRIVMQRKTKVSLRAASAQPIWPLPIDRDLFAPLMIALAVIALWILLVTVDGAVERPVTASVALVLSVLIAAPPNAWAMGRKKGGGGGGSSVTRTRYLFHDHLGSEVLAVRAGGGVEERRIFEPFGEVIDSQIDILAPVATAFTGKLYHDEVSLYNFGARWYDSEAGRFVSVDPVVQTVADPQTHNPYGYARNNPIGNIDPDGREVNSSGGGGGGFFLVALFGGGKSKNAPPPDPTPHELPDSSDFVVVSNAAPDGGALTQGLTLSTAKKYGGGSQSGSNPDPLGPNPGNFFKVEVLGVDVVTPLGGFEFSSGFFVGRNRAGDFQAGPFVEGGPAIGGGLSVDTLGVEFISNIDQLDRSYSINGVLGGGIFNAQGNINPTPPNHGKRFLGDFVNGTGVGLSFGPLPVEGFASFTQTRTFDVIGFGRRVFGQQVR